MYKELPENLKELALYDGIFHAILVSCEKSNVDYQTMLERSLIEIAKERHTFSKQVVRYAEKYGILKEVNQSWSDVKDASKWVDDLRGN